MPLSSLEREVFFWLHGFDWEPLNQLMTLFSSTFIWLPVLSYFAIKAWLSFSRRDFYVLILLAVLLLAVVDSSTSYFFKNIFQRLRPCKMHELRPLITKFGQGCGGYWGFFSSHAANAIALVLFFTGFLRLSKRLRFLLWCFVLLVSYSRIYLGVHLPLDIVAGLLWGSLVAWPWRWITRMSLKGQAAL